MPSARPARVAGRRLHAIRSDPAALTHAFILPRVGPPRSRCWLATTLKSVRPRYPIVSPSRTHRSIVQSGPCVASRCARCRACASLGGRAPLRAPRRAANKQHRAGSEHCPDAQYHQPLFHFTSPHKPRIAFFCVPYGRAPLCLYNGGPGHLIRVKTKRFTPGKILIATAAAACRAIGRKPLSHKALSGVQPASKNGCTFLFGGVRFAQLLVFHQAFVWYPKKETWLAPPLASRSTTSCVPG